MATSSPTKPTRAGPITRPPSDGSPTNISTPATSTLPSTIAHTLPAPSRLMLPPPNPTPPSSPSPLPPTSVDMTSVCSTNTAISSTISSPSSAHPPSAAIPELATSPRNLKLQSQILTLQLQIATTQTSLNDTLAKLQDRLSTTTTKRPPGHSSGSPQNEADSQVQAEAMVKRHIKLLHTYNEIKDVGQGLMGLIADSRGVRLKEVMEEIGVGEKD